MEPQALNTRLAVVTGAAGQDARYLIPELLRRGYEVHAFVRSDAAGAFDEKDAQLQVHAFDLASSSAAAADAIAALRPAVVFNFAGQSSVAASFERPHLSWALNAEWPAVLLDAIRRHSPETRVYQASSSEMFGCLPGESVVHDEQSAFRPQSPYAASKAAAHLLCGVYRQSFGIRVACGILFNHESRYRGEPFVTTKITRHVRALRALPASERDRFAPLRVGRLDVQRDWGWAAEYARGILMIADQIEARRARGGEDADVASNYRDYVLGTGVLTSVRELIDRAFALGGVDLDWHVQADGRGHALFAGTGVIAVESAPEFYRAAEPKAIQADPSRARNELGWRATPDIDVFLKDMIFDGEGAPR
jgi:GDPmannose 4,6-dehydratase